jgi:hypothetical protein
MKCKRGHFLEIFFEAVEKDGNTFNVSVLLAVISEQF